MYTHILIATDGSELAEAGLTQGLALAKALGARVTVLSVQVPLTGLALEALMESTAVEAYESSLAEVTARTGRMVAERAAAVGVAAEFVALTRELPAPTIVETAAERGCDLIVMTSHGRRGLTRLVLGSQTAEVLALAQVPVLVVR